MDSTAYYGIGHLGKTLCSFPGRSVPLGHVLRQGGYHAILGGHAFMDGGGLFLQIGHPGVKLGKFFLGGEVGVELAELSIGQRLGLLLGEACRYPALDKTVGVQGQGLVGLGAHESKCRVAGKAESNPSLVQ